MILITGCAGYIGRHLARALRADGLAVRGLDRDAARLAELAALGVETVAADVGDAGALVAALRGVEVVYHLAGSALGTPEEIVRGNVAGARAVAATCAGTPGVRTIIYAGSGALYPSGDAWLGEDTPPEPAFHYARAKAEAEQLLLRAHARVGLPVIVARIAGVYGLGSPNLMTEQVRRGRFPLIGGGHGYASYIHIDDTVAGLRALAERGRPGQIYNLADDEPTLIRDFYGELARLLGGPPPPTMAPAAARALVWALGALARLRGRPAPLPPDLADMAAVSHRMANRRMREELGVTPRYPSYRDGLPTCVGDQGL
ncbi:NAD-dependent epimerase/dehydratase family protein [Oscillochloris sp. ZM17-4]|uniref:NAD-dependent epimerase/dehydratase family protein n=1 Tax=Oscillochloris sp. ZM17-4 TaxID=2866714 RepID=UPI001C735212|nr:NAD-dependent epimerase/dehydratase family protein [Oscillochloris sp. ZM17-4]MBX0328116.1 NAD-dependent epimerase/dehydratase family protein [Oscillochloris sp. ZM17-4]